MKCCGGRKSFLVLVAGFSIGAAPAFSQTYYKWTDEQGVVHLSDQAPAAAKGVQERVLEPLPAARLQQPESIGDVPAPAGQLGAGAKPAAAGPARVVLDGYQSPRTGPSSMIVNGTVKNVGGETAEDVVVRLSAADAAQGNPCLDTEVSVNPSTLGAGESGTFDTALDDPCLSGEAKIEVRPHWAGNAEP